MKSLIIAEHDNASINAATLNTVAAAQKIGGEIHVLVAGHNAYTCCREDAEGVGGQMGVEGRRQTR